MQKDSQKNTTYGSEEDSGSLEALGKGFQIGEYVIEDILGHGAMATVFLATDRTGHEVALKIFQEGPGVSKTMLERFRREAEASKKLRRHPHIMTIFSTGKEGPYHYIAMETIKRSKTFEAALESTPMNMRDIVQVIVKIARALQYAHKRHIIHRDVKLTNIMINEFGEPLLADFGVAELIDWPSCTMTGALTGTPLYMSPEQARGERVGVASDIYSLGVVLYESVTGVLPYHAHHRSRVKEVLKAVKEENPRRPRLFRREISHDLEAVMLKALEKKPENRYPDAEAFAVDLERALAGRRVSAHHFSPLDRVRHKVRQHKQTLYAAGAAVVVGFGVNLFFRAQIMTARFEGLLHLAQLREIEHVLRQVTHGNADVRSTSQAWHEIRRGRRAMLSGDWDEAWSLLQRAVALSNAVDDGRTAAIARLDQARCAVMLNRREQAAEIYRTILRDPAVTPVMSGIAEMEYLILILSGGERDTALNVLVEYGLPTCGPIRESIRCIVGDIAPEKFLSNIGHMPEHFRNDGYFAAAVRYHLDGKRRDALKLLRLCAQSSAPSMEWPAPMARRLEDDLRD